MYKGMRRQMIQIICRRAFLWAFDKHYTRKSYESLRYKNIKPNIEVKNYINT